jgi:hypothetical protein
MSDSWDGQIEDGAAEGVALDAEALAATMDRDALDQAIYKGAPVVIATLQDLMGSAVCDRVTYEARRALVAILERLGRISRRDCAAAQAA